jgi:hypothetical protein
MENCNTFINVPQLDVGPVAVSSVHNQLGFHVSNTLKNKTISGQYVDLALLLESQPSENEVKSIEFGQSGQLFVKPAQASKAIQY